MDTSEETSLDSETSPNNDRSRLTGRFDSDETEAANMLGTWKSALLITCIHLRHSFILYFLLLQYRWVAHDVAHLRLIRRALQLFHRAMLAYSLQ